MIQFTAHELANLLFPSDSLGLDEAREWCARNIIDYHGSECRCIPPALAVAVRETDPGAAVLHVLVCGPENKFFVLWRTPVWHASRHRIVTLRASLNAAKVEREILQAHTAAEIAYRKTCVEWLGRVASNFCAHSPGYRVSWLRDSFIKLASRANYDMDALFTVLINMVEEHDLRATWIGAPMRRIVETTITVETTTHSISHVENADNTTSHHGNHERNEVPAQEVPSAGEEVAHAVDQACAYAGEVAAPVRSEPAQA